VNAGRPGEDPLAGVDVDGAAFGVEGNLDEEDGGWVYPAVGLDRDGERDALLLGRWVIRRRDDPREVPGTVEVGHEVRWQHGAAALLGQRFGQPEDDPADGGRIESLVGIWAPGEGDRGEAHQAAFPR
jgi:hypothetical protein